MILLVVFYAIMATVYTFGKTAVTCAPPFFLTAIRITPGGILFLSYQYLKNGSFSFPKKWDWGYILLYSSIIFVMDSFRLISLQYVPASNAALIATTAPFIAAFLCWWFFKEHLTLLKMSALALGIGGVMPLLLSRSNLTSMPLSNALFGYGMMAISTVGFVLAGILSQILINKKGYPFFTIVGTVMTGGGLTGLLFSLLYNTWDPTPLYDPIKALPIIGFLIVFHSCMAYPLYNYLVQCYPVTLVAFAQLMTPFFTALFGWYFFNEEIGMLFFQCLAALTIALFLFYYAEFKEGLISN